jgi:hypothetical protein
MTTINGQIPYNDMCEILTATAKLYTKYIFIECPQYDVNSDSLSAVDKHSFSLSLHIHFHQGWLTRLHTFCAFWPSTQQIFK